MMPDYYDFAPEYNTFYIISLIITILIIVAIAVIGFLKTIKKPKKIRAFLLYIVSMVAAAFILLGFREWLQGLTFTQGLYGTVTLTDNKIWYKLL